MPPLTQPPDPNPRKPTLQCPPGAVDTHIHLFGPAAKYPFDPGSRYISNDMLPETNLALQDTLGLSRAIVISGGGYGVSYRHLADVLVAFPDRFRGVALLPPQTSAAEIAQLDRLGVRGARFHVGVLLPAALPGILTGLKLGWSFAWRALMAGELLFVAGGLGQLLQNSREVLDAAAVMGVMVAIVAIGVAVDRVLFRVLELRVRRRWGLLEARA